MCLCAHHENLRTRQKTATEDTSSVAHCGASASITNGSVDLRIVDGIRQGDKTQTNTVSRLLYLRYFEDGALGNTCINIWLSPMQQLFVFASGSQLKKREHRDGGKSQQASGDARGGAGDHGVLAHAVGSAFCFKRFGELQTQCRLCSYGPLRTIGHARSLTSKLEHANCNNMHVQIRQFLYYFCNIHSCHESLVGPIIDYRYVLNNSILITIISCRNDKSDIDTVTVWSMIPGKLDIDTVVTSYYSSTRVLVLQQTRVLEYDFTRVLRMWYYRFFTAVAIILLS